MGKPTGTIPTLNVFIDADGAPHKTIEKLPFPKEKEDIEVFAVNRFLVAGEKLAQPLNKRFFISDPIKNSESDFDFTVAIPRGKAYLELMEIAPLSLSNTTHDKAANRYDTYEIAKFASDQIINKSKKYGSQQTAPIFLLLYITNYKFIFSGNAKLILNYLCHTNKHNFSLIMLLTFRTPPFDDQLDLMYPTPSLDIGSFNIEAHRGMVINFDPASVEVSFKK